MRLVPIVRDRWAVLVLPEDCGQTPGAGRVDTSKTVLCIGRSGQAPRFAWTRSASANRRHGGLKLSTQHCFEIVCDESIDAESFAGVVCISFSKPGRSICGCHTWLVDSDACWRTSSCRCEGEQISQRLCGFTFGRACELRPVRSERGGNVKASRGTAGSTSSENSNGKTGSANRSTCPASGHGQSCHATGKSAASKCLQPSASFKAAVTVFSVAVASRSATIFE